MGARGERERETERKGVRERGGQVGLGGRCGNAARARVTCKGGGASGDLVVFESTRVELREAGCVSGSRTAQHSERPPSVMQRKAHTGEHSERESVGECGRVRERALRVC
eukprot:795804-Rhodomonas_salina.1